MPSTKRAATRYDRGRARRLAAMLTTLALGLLILPPLYAEDPVAKKKATTPWTVEDVLQCEEASSFRISPDCRWVVWVRKVPDKEKNERVGQLMLSSLTDDKEIQLTRGRESCLEPKWSPDGQRITFLTSREPPKTKSSPSTEEPASQLWLINPFGGEPWPLTSQSRGVLKHEWAGPDSIIFSAKEEQEDEEVDEGPSDTTIVVEDEAKEPPVRLFTLVVKTKEVKSLTQNTDRISTFALSPDGSHLVTFHDRSLRYEYDNRIKPIYFLTNVKTGGRKQIFAEGKFNLEHVLWAPDGKGFYVANAFTTHPRYVMATMTELYYYDLATATPARIDLNWDRGLSDQWEDEDSAPLRATEDGFFTILANGARNVVALYSRQANSWRRAPIQGEHEEHIFGFDLGRDGKTLVYAYSTASTPTQWFRARLVGGRLQGPVQFTHLNEHLAARPRARTELVHWQGARAEQVEGLLYYPHRYEPGQKYPLIVLIHGGPAMADFDAWYESWSHPQNLLCSRGAFVLRPNYHGSSNYGLAWAESICCGRYYDLEIPDIEKGVDALIARGLVDPEHLGVMGFSNGAILSAALTVHTTRYKAASCMAGTVEQASDWGATKYGDSFDQYYFGKSPFQDPQLYVRKSPFFQMERVRTPTIIFCGSDDKIVGSSQAWLHYRALQQLDKTAVRFLLFPGEGHDLEQLTHQRRKLREELAWFDKYLFAPQQEKNASRK